MLNEIKNRLGENYRNDDTVLNNLIDEATTIALSVSNMKKTNQNLSLLKPYIVDYVLSEYLNRGGEGLDSLSEGGKSSSFRNNKDDLRQNLIRDGLRRIC